MPYDINDGVVIRERDVVRHTAIDSKHVTERKRSRCWCHFILWFFDLLLDFFLSCFLSFRPDRIFYLWNCFWFLNEQSDHKHNQHITTHSNWFPTNKIIKKMLRFLFGCCFVGAGFSSDLPIGFFLDIDGISVSLSTANLCSLESKPGVQIGGTPICWGYEGKDLLQAPSNVRSLSLSLYFSILFWLSPYFV